MQSTFVEEEYAGIEAVIPIPSIGGNLPLAEIYEQIEFMPELLA